MLKSVVAALKIQGSLCEHHVVGPDVMLRQCPEGTVKALLRGQVILQPQRKAKPAMAEI